MASKEKKYDALNNFFYSWSFYQTDGKESDILDYDYNNDLYDYYNAWSPENGLIEFSFASNLSASPRQPKKWSKEEVALLNLLKKQDLTYAQISDEMLRKLHVRREPIYIQQRWERIQKPGIKKGRFAAHECRILLDALKTNLLDYSELAEKLGRTTYYIKRKVQQLKTNSIVQ